MVPARAHPGDSEQEATQKGHLGLVGRHAKETRKRRSYHSHSCPRNGVLAWCLSQSAELVEAPHPAPRGVIDCLVGQPDTLAEPRAVLEMRKSDCLHSGASCSFDLILGPCLPSSRLPKQSTRAGSRASKTSPQQLPPLLPPPRRLRPLLPAILHRPRPPRPLPPRSQGDAAARRGAPVDPASPASDGPRWMRTAATRVEAVKAEAEAARPKRRAQRTGRAA